MTDQRYKSEAGALESCPWANWSFKKCFLKMCIIEAFGEGLNVRMVL